MSRTLQTLQTMVRRRLGWPATDSFVTDAELREMLRESQRELHDLLTVTYGDEYRVVTQTVAVTSGITSYTLPSVSRVHRVSVRFDGVSTPFRRRQIQSDTVDHTARAWDRATDMSFRLARFGDSRDAASTLVHVHPVPNAAYVLRVAYTSNPDTMSVSTAINSIGYDEYLVLDTMIKLRNMEEIDPADLIQKLERLKAQIQTDAPPLDMGQPQVINDARSAAIYRGGRWP